MNFTCDCEIISKNKYYAYAGTIIAIVAIVLVILFA